MKNQTISILKTIVFFSILFCLPFSAVPCTIVSAIAANGHVWNANNEDGPFGIANFINVYPKSKDQKYGYYTLSYLSPKYGQGGQMQGGMNEAGLTFDFNAIPKVEDFDPKSKKVFPKGDNAILPFILANFNSVEQVIDFFNTYWFQNGFTSAQMHVADKQGNFAIISASGMKLVKNGNHLVSTNFDICKKEENTSCWRYPIATAKLSKLGASLSTMTAICKETAQKNGATMYSNIQNLTTGDIWFFSKHDPDTLIKTNINDLISKGNVSYSFSDLKSIQAKDKKHISSKPTEIPLNDTVLDNYIGIYKNGFIGNVMVKKNRKGLEILFSDGMKLTVNPSASDTFFFPFEDIVVRFSFDKERDKMSINFFENGLWSFTAWEASS
ncbi:carcinine hydrolase/isopenicillin-N N-acyltransferase family protein [Aquimarina litoralis]|uniref:carcinine hydrolase/isopenicillin-N N-acyltransferase family protein n=1 Tax=Aquimarina litoralis TaxID=584605 RepID=UPI001C56CC02|nr:carcinine hydrolase/isopenicillin-N N-acyltransferase family protein [Aquimarina litoralis]MBW1298525.1 hypothetical protein [Aquimarina litoralis]